jgi:DNA-binding PadR family transcriptional regulator
MSRADYPGAFEQVVMLAVARLGEQAYGMRVRREIESRSGRSVSIGAVYATLDRLAGKGYVKHRDGGSSAAREGRARRYFTLTASGVEALESARDVQARMWAGLKLPRVWRRS